jgi:hypothetical protein
MAQADAAGKGVLRLTTNGKQQSGFVLYTKPLNASAGLNISFDMYQFHTTTARRGGADGTGEIKLDVSDAPKAGPANGPVTLRYDAPPDSTVLAAAGNAWTCAVQPVRATCTRPGRRTHGEALRRRRRHRDADRHRTG